MFRNFVQEPWSKKGSSHVNASWKKIYKKKMVKFGYVFWAFLGTILGPHFGTRSAKEGARWAQESHQELQRAKKLHFQKPWKTNSFLVFLDPEASQENLKRPEKVPKRHPKRSKGGPKLGQKVAKKWTQKRAKKVITYLEKIALTGFFLGRFWGHGAFKKGLFRRCQKIVQDA